MTDDTIEADDVVETTIEPQVEAETHHEESKAKIRNPELALRSLRKENEQLRKTQAELVAARAEELTNEKLEAIRKEYEEKSAKSTQKLLDKARSELEEAAKTRSAKQALKAEARLAGVADFEDFYEIAKKAALSKVEFDADGDVINAAELVAELKQSKPHLFVPISTASTAKPPVERTDTTVDYRTASNEDFAAALRKMGVRIPGV